MAYSGQPAAPLAPLRPARPADAAGAASSSGRIGAPPSADPSPHRLPPTRRAWRRLRVIRRGLVIFGWTLISGVIQSAMLALPGRGKARFARLYWSAICTLLGMKVRVIGTPATGGARPVVYACNHSSWLDVPVLGGSLLACFVSKDDVGRWPVVGQVARLGRTIFVSRQRGTTGRERDDMRLRLAAGDDLILFPEGTSSDGTRVLPFHSSFFAAAKPSGAQDELQQAAARCRPLVQPVSVVYDRLAGLPVGNARRSVFSWYGDMDLASHFWQLAQWRSMRASILLHAPLDPADFPTRKALAQAAWDAVAEGAALLRQNRPVARPADLPTKLPVVPLADRVLEPPAGRPVEPPAPLAAHGREARPACVAGADSSLDNPAASFA